MGVCILFGFCCFSSWHSSTLKDEEQVVPVRAAKALHDKPYGCKQQRATAMAS